MSSPRDDSRTPSPTPFEVASSSDEAFPLASVAPDEASSTTAASAIENARSLLQTVDAETRRLARSLLRAARDGSLAALRPGDGHPAVTRVLVATDFVGRPILLLSELSAHAKALAADKRCSLLVSRPGKGDPLAHPRMTVFAEARPVGADDEARAGLRERMLARHPKAALYIDFADFFFVRLEPSGASLNGGFARAFELATADFVDAETPDLEASAARARDHMNADHADAIDTIARSIGAEGTGWRIATMDASGFEIARGDQLQRAEFEEPASASTGGYRSAFLTLVGGGEKSDHA